MTMIFFCQKPDSPDYKDERIAKGVVLGFARVCQIFTLQNHNRKILLIW